MRRHRFRRWDLLVVCAALLAGCSPQTELIFGRGGGEVHWLDVAGGNVAEAVRTLKRGSWRAAWCSWGTQVAPRLPQSLLGVHPDIADAALLVACGCGEARSLQPLDAAGGFRRDVVVRLLVGEKDDVTPAAQSQRYAEALRQRGVDAQVTVLPGLEHNITFTQPVFAEAARLASAPR